MGFGEVKQNLINLASISYLINITQIDCTYKVCTVMHTGWILYSYLLTCLVSALSAIVATRTRPVDYFDDRQIKLWYFRPDQIQEEVSRDSMTDHDNIIVVDAEYASDRWTDTTVSINLSWWDRYDNSI